MSFSYKTKIELSKLPLQNECCYLAELSAIIRTAGTIFLENGKLGVLIRTEIPEVYAKINTILEKLYGFSVELELAEDEAYYFNVRYEIKISTEHASEVLTDCGIIYLDDNHQTEFNVGIDKYIVMDDCCKKSYIRGAFIGCGTTNIVLSDQSEKVDRINSGYHLEFVFSNDALATDFAMLLAEFDIISKKVERRASYIVYLKEGEIISDLLALMGASHSVLELQNEITFRSLRNQVNRQNNCLTANIGKVVNASLKQLNAIETIKQIIGIQQLPLPLQEAAMLRLANPEESLDNLVKLSAAPITKSGLNHRLKRLIEIADELNSK
ncbi:MAG: DNA-binding protein WhiA [Spirochaetales bacterium]